MTATEQPVDVLAQSIHMVEGNDVRGELEHSFTEEFNQHVKEKNRRSRFKLGAFGAGIGGFIGVAASPVLLPGLAIAAVAGGAGGYQYAKKRGKERQKRHSSDDCGRPSLRRLKFLVQWGLMRLLDHEDSPAEYRCAVIDEVVQAFAPWVQQAYFLKAKGQAGPGPKESPELQKLLQHLEPLFHFLQNKAVMDAVVQSAQSVEEAFDTHSLNHLHGERCRISFPAILETISLLDRVGLEKYIEFHSDFSPKAAAGKQSRRRQRLQNIVETLKKVCDREDVQNAVSNPQCFSQALIASNVTSTVDHTPVSPRSGSSDSGHAQVTPPPEGAELEDDDQAYYSASSADEEEEEKEAKLGPPSCANNSGTCHSACIEERMKMLCRDGTIDNSWALFDPALCNVRSATYLADRVKEPSGPAMFELLSLDMVLIGPDGPAKSVARHLGYYPQYARRSGDDRFLLIQNWIFPPYQGIMTAALDPNAPWLLDENSPQHRVWKRFLDGDDDVRRSLFKMLLQIEKAPWLVRRALKNPLIIGSKLKLDTEHEPGSHLELVMDVSTGGSSERRLTGMVCKLLKSLELVYSCMIEGQTEDQLPEALLFSTRILHLDPSRVVHPA